MDLIPLTQWSAAVFVLLVLLTAGCTAGEVAPKPVESAAGPALFVPLLSTAPPLREETPARPKPAAPVMMTGPATTVFQGEIELPELT